MDWTIICSIIPGRANHEPAMTTRHLTFKLFVGDDLDAEAGQSLVVVHRRCEVADRGHAEITQDLRTDTDLAPLPVAVGLCGFFLRQRCNRNAGGAIAQVDQDASAGALEMIEHVEHALMPGEDVP